MTELGGFILGILLHVLAKWAGWKTKANTWMAYWSEYTGLVVAGVIGSGVLFGFWQAGALPWAAEKVLGMFLPAGAPVPPVPSGFWGAILAGWVADSFSKTLWRTVERKAQDGTP